MYVCKYDIVCMPVTLRNANYPARMRKGVKQSVLSVVCTKIATLEIWASERPVSTINPSKSAKKLASVCFDSFGTAHERHKYRILSNYGATLI